jgi:hypothetical protein
VNAAKLLWGLGHDVASGTVLVRLQGQRLSPVRIELYRGWVHAIDLFPIQTIVGKAPGRGEDTLRLLFKRSDADWSFDPLLPALKRGACPPFHPAAVVRNVIAASGDAFRARTVAGARLQLLRAPHASCIGLDERTLVSFLTQPHTLAEVDAARLCPPARAAALLAFLEAVGALTVDADLSRRQALALLELGDSASADEVKRAYRRLARTLHPDAHPAAAAAELRELERRFAAVAAAYRRLSSSSSVE